MNWDNKLKFNVYFIDSEWKKIYINFTLVNTSWDRYTAKIDWYWFQYTWRWWNQMRDYSNWLNGEWLWIVVTSWFILNQFQLENLEKLLEYDFVQKEFWKIAIKTEFNKKNEKIISWIIELLLNKSRETDSYWDLENEVWLDLDLSDLDLFEIEKNDDELELIELLEKYEIYHWMFFVFMIENCKEMTYEEKENEKEILRSEILKMIKDKDFRFESLTRNLTILQDKITETVDSFHEYAKIYFNIWEEKSCNSWFKVKLVSFEENREEPYLRINQVFWVKDLNWEEHYLKFVEDCDWNWYLNFNSWWNFIECARVRLCVKEKFIDISYKYKWNSIWVWSEFF